MFSLRLALLGVVVVAVTGGVVKFTSFLGEKDHQIQERDQMIIDLNAKVAGLRTDLEREQTSNTSLMQDLQRKVEEAAKARQEANQLRATDTVSSQRQRDLERKLNDRERIEQVDRLTHSRGAERVVQVVNRSAKCEIENFFQPDGQCKGGVWVTNAPKPPAGSDAARAPAEGASDATR
jgi:septal ring factor EnvC (AmiA/AmiB activator)